MFGGGQVNPHHRDPVTTGQFAGDLCCLRLTPRCRRHTVLSVQASAGTGDKVMAADRVTAIIVKERLGF
jgi:hypothetical protein